MKSVLQKMIESLSNISDVMSLFSGGIIEKSHISSYVAAFIYLLISNSMSFYYFST